MSISVPAFERRVGAKPNAKTANAIKLSFFHMIDAFLLFRGLNQRIAAKLQKCRRCFDRWCKSFNYAELTKRARDPHKRTQT